MRCEDNVFFFSISWWEKRKDREGSCGGESLCEWRRMSANNHDMYFATLQIKSLLVIWEKSIFWAVVEWFVLGMIVWSTLPVWDAQSESCPAEDFWEKKKQIQLSEPKEQLRILWMPILSESLSYITSLFNKQFTALEICLSARTNLFFGFFSRDLSNRSLYLPLLW